MQTLRKEKERATEILRIVVAICLFLAPWVLGFATNMSAAWNARFCAAAIALLAIWALYEFENWQEWLSALLGVWTIVAPWVLGLAQSAKPARVHVLLGLIVALCATVRLSMRGWGRPKPT